MSHLGELLLSRLAARPARVFLSSPDGAAVTCGELCEASERYAAALRDLGVAAGERVVAQTPRCPEVLALYLACLRLGAVYVPLNPAYGSDETAYFLDDARPALYVAAADAAAAWRGPTATLDGQGGGTLAEHARRCRGSDILEPRAGDDVAAMLYTSGTTGRPRGALLTHRNLSSNALALQRIWGWREDDVLLHALPLFHVHGLFVAMHCAMLGASTVVFLPRFDACAVREALRRCTVMMGVPTFYSRLLALTGFGAADCAGVRLFVSGSAPLAPKLFDDFVSRTGHRILERYGMTETGMISSNPLEGQRVAGTVGYPLPEVELRIVDDSGATLPPGDTGRVEVRGPNVCAGYWRRPQQTAASFRSGGWFVTGDLGCLDDEGRLTLVGRAGDLIITGGYNVYPREVEDVLDAVPGVRESAVVGVGDEDLGEVVAAAVVGDVDAAALRAAAARRLVAYKRPRRIAVLDALPRNAMGKVRKDLLRASLAAPPAPRRSGSGPGVGDESA